MFSPMLKLPRAVNCSFPVIHRLPIPRLKCLELGLGMSWPGALVSDHLTHERERCETALEPFGANQGIDQERSSGVAGRWWSWYGGEGFEGSGVFAADDLGFGVAAGARHLFRAGDCGRRGGLAEHSMDPRRPKHT